jgi:uncharacterized protein YcbK (DUF882 family)
VSTHARRVVDYFAWLVNHEIPYGFDLELARLCARDGNDAPPKDRWPRILPTLAVLTTVREKFGPTTIRSGYRSPSYNASTPDAAKNSRHVAGDAIDFRCARGTPAEWAAFLREVRGTGGFTGGVGLYPSFVHVDTRGSNADWTGA